MPSVFFKPVLVIAVALAVLSTQAAAVMTAGAIACGDWVKNSASNGWEKTVQQFWIAGYLTGKADGTGIDVLKEKPPMSSLSLWVDNYCKNNPLNDSFDAGNMLFLELKNRIKK